MRKEKVNRFKILTFPLKTYCWEGINFSGKFVCGILQAKQKSFVRQEIRMPGITHLVVRRVSESIMHRPFRLREVIRFIELMRIFFRCGMKINEAISGVVQEGKSVQLKYIGTTILQNLNRGQTFSESFEVIKLQLPTLFVRLIRMGDETQKILEILDYILEYYEYSNSRKKILADLVRYPLVVLSAVIFLFLLSVLFVIPMFRELYYFIGDDLNSLTRTLVSVSEFLSIFGIQILLFLLFFVSLYRVPKLKFLSPAYYMW